MERYMNRQNDILPIVVGILLTAFSIAWLTIQTSIRAEFTGETLLAIVAIVVGAIVAIGIAIADRKEQIRSLHILAATIEVIDDEGPIDLPELYEKVRKIESCSQKAVIKSIKGLRTERKIFYNRDENMKIVKIRKMENLDEYLKDVQRQANEIITTVGQLEELKAECKNFLKNPWDLAEAKQLLKKIKKVREANL